MFLFVGECQTSLSQDRSLNSLSLGCFGNEWKQHMGLCLPYSQNELGGKEN